MTDLTRPGQAGLAVEVGPMQMMLDLEQAGALTPVSLDLPRELSWERYEALGVFLGRVKHRSSWWIGDWLNYGEDAFPDDRYVQAADATGLENGTLRNYAWICRQVPKSRRVDGVSFGIHGLVAPLEPDEQIKWLDVALREGLTRDQLRDRIRAASGVAAGGGNGDGYLSRSGVIEAAARNVSGTAQPRRGGGYTVPDEPMAQLRAALGEGE